MKKVIPILLFVLVFAVVACDKPIIPKPDHLIKQDQMIDMLADMHLAEATQLKFRNDSVRKFAASVDYYYSVLAKYDVPDSVFEKSFVYYASEPKNFEKMYRKVMNQLSQMEQELSGRKQNKLDLGEDSDIGMPRQ
jgi:hypothetical protein